MRPLLQKELSSFLERFDNFKDAEFRSLDILSATSMKLIFAVQDRARAFDWITIELEFSGITDARLVGESQISLLDMSDGISIIEDENKFAFAVSECYNVSQTKNSSCYVITQSIKYKESQF